MDNIYKHFLSLFFALSEQILKIPGIKYIPKGYNKGVINPIIESFIKWICVFLYTPQKQVIKIQNEVRKEKDKIKKKINLIFIFDIKLFIPSINLFLFFSFLSFKISSSVKANLFMMILITIDIKVEYNIWGNW